jgi:predicted PurR-regulated permease PerM
MERRPAFHVILVCASIVLILAIVSPLWQPLLTAAVLAATLRPWHDGLASRLRGRRGIAAALLLAGLVLLVVIPIAWVVSVAVYEAIGGIDLVRKVLENRGTEGLLEYLPDWMVGPAEHALDQLSATARGWISSSGVKTAAAVGNVLGATAHLVVSAIFLLIAFYFFLLNGRQLVGWLVSISPAPDEASAVADRLALGSRSVLSSLFLTALAQGICATVGYVIGGVPQPIFFGFLTLLAAFVPSVGTAIIALPVAGIMFVLGHPWAALFLALWALLVVGLIDNLVRPLLIKGGVQIDAAVLFFALVGGLALLGPIGLLVGPLAVVLFVTVVTHGSPR